ncbi:MAG: hypothetical protein DWQ07_23475 [Chloroflexi bacterium]|nr:MAG: hypothetical protein DWQ07_23475 [Chloroflexota bacterium]MBL1194111.1 hypothetical protein [Chloroflexota bacterium]NOH11404.1 hypothetical protein [Chloroflexota bacterium]
MSQPLGKQALVAGELLGVVFIEKLLRLAGYDYPEQKKVDTCSLNEVFLTETPKAANATPYTPAEDFGLALTILLARHRMTWRELAQETRIPYNDLVLLRRGQAEFSWILKHIGVIAREIQEPIELVEKLLMHSLMSKIDLLLCEEKETNNKPNEEITNGNKSTTLDLK